MSHSVSEPKAPRLKTRERLIASLQRAKARHRRIATFCLLLLLLLLLFTCSLHPKTFRESGSSLRGAPSEKRNSSASSVNEDSRTSSRKAIREARSYFEFLLAIVTERDFETQAVGSLATDQLVATGSRRAYGVMGTGVTSDGVVATAAGSPNSWSGGSLGNGYPATGVGGAGAPGNTYGGPVTAGDGHAAIEQHPVGATTSAPNACQNENGSQADGPAEGSGETTPQNADASGGDQGPGGDDPSTKASGSGTLELCAAGNAQASSDNQAPHGGEGGAANAATSNSTAWNNNDVDAYLPNLTPSYPGEVPSADLLGLDQNNGSVDGQTPLNIPTVAEPSSLALILGGFLCLIATFRRKFAARSSADTAQRAYIAPKKT